MRCGPRRAGEPMAGTSCRGGRLSPSRSGGVPSALMGGASLPGSVPQPASNCLAPAPGEPRRGKQRHPRLRRGRRPTTGLAGGREAFCRQRGISHARLRGGVGSIIGARFADGGSVVPFATELLINAGEIAHGAGGALEAQLDVALVDYLGGLAEGRLVRGDNPVLMTMELVLEPLEAGRG